MYLLCHLIPCIKGITPDNYLGEFEVTLLLEARIDLGIVLALFFIRFSRFVIQ